ncbi:unnamed protein product, partial [marine sediment metagenome]
VLQSHSVNYKMNLSKKNVLEMARKLTDVSLKSLNFEKFQEMEEGLMVLRNEKDPSASFEMDTRSGNFLYNGGLGEYKNDGDTPNLILGEKASSIALQHLEKLGLLPNKQELNLVNIGGLNMAVLKKDSTTDVYKKLVTVRYNRKLADIPVMGESRIILHMGKNGKLAGLTYYWGEIVDKRKIEIGEVLTDKEIKRELESRLRAAARDAKRIIVKKADFVLYDDGRGHIEPAYHVQARLFYEASDKKGEKKIQKYDIPYDFYIPVLKNPLAFYPYMETAKVQPTDARKLEITPKDDE